MDKTTSGLAIVAFVLVILLGGALSYSFGPTHTVTVDKPVDKLVFVPNNDSALKADIAAIKAEVNKDDSWKTQALDLASADWRERSFRDVFEFLVDNGYNITDKEDISSITVKDTDVSGIDVDQGDADVWQELKVYYEDTDGDNKKVLVDVDTTVKDSEVDDQVFSLA